MIKDTKRNLKEAYMEKEIDKSEYNMLPDLIVLSLQIVGEDPFSRLVEWCEPITYSVIKRYFFQDYEQEDFLQEARAVLVKAVYDWRIDKGMPFTQFYHMQLTNHLNMLVRKNHAQKRRINLYTSSLDSLVEEAGVHIRGVADSSTQPEEMMIANDTYDKYLETLSELESKVFRLTMEKNSYLEMSKELSLTVDQVRSALYRCRVKLNRVINTMG